MAGQGNSIWTYDLQPITDKVVRVVVILSVSFLIIGGGAYLWLSRTIDVDAAKDFMNVWVQNSSAASSKLERRSPDVARDLVRTTKLKTFDGVFTDVGEDKITISATGVQYAVHNYRVVPVVDLAGVYMPLPMTISVATDTHQVFSAQPDAVP